MFHVPLGNLDKVGDEVIAALQLDVDLGKRVLEAVAEGDERVVDARDPKAEDHDNGEQNEEDN
jgi:hypothetical protein